MVEVTGDTKRSLRMPRVELAWCDFLNNERSIDGSMRTYADYPVHCQEG